MAAKTTKIYTHKTVATNGTICVLVTHSNALPYTHHIGNPKTLILCDDGNGKYELAIFRLCPRKHSVYTYVRNNP